MEGEWDVRRLAKAGLRWEEPISNLRFEILKGGCLLPGRGNYLTLVVIVVGKAKGVSHSREGII